MQSPAAAIAPTRSAHASLRQSEDGQDLLEYGLLMTLIAVFAMGAIATLGTTITRIFWSVIAISF